MISLNAAETYLAEYSAVTEPNQIAQRLLAHARLCREVARESHCDSMAETLDRLAEDCVQAARIADLSALGWNPASRPSA